MDPISLGREVCDALNKLEELCRLDNRVRDRRFLDELFLSNLGTEVGTLGEALGTGY